MPLPKKLSNSGQKILKGMKFSEVRRIIFHGCDPDDISFRSTQFDNYLPVIDRWDRKEVICKIDTSLLVPRPTYLRFAQRTYNVVNSLIKWCSVML